MMNNTSDIIERDFNRLARTFKSRVPEWVPERRMKDFRLRCILRRWHGAAYSAAWEAWPMPHYKASSKALKFIMPEWAYNWNSNLIHGNNR